MRFKPKEYKIKNMETIPCFFFVVVVVEIH